MSLSAIAIRNAKLAAKPYKLADGGGLYLLVNSVGRYFRLDYRFGGKRKTFALGVFPETSLAEAREKRDHARKLLANGIDPAAQRKLLKTVQEGQAANSFEVVAREWFVKFSVNWAATHGDKIIRRLELDVFPWVGARAVDEIMAPELLQLLRRIESRGARDTAHRAMQNCGQVFRYAIATGRAQRNPAADLRGALAPVKEHHFPAITDPKAIGELLRAIDGYHGSLVTKCALRLAPFVFVRPGELRQAKWEDVDLDAAEWRYTLSKVGTGHIVPLATQALMILRELQPLTGAGPYLFPSERGDSRPMSDNAILAALRRMGYPKEQIVGHGFRAMARTLLDEVLHFRPDYIEHQLGHRV
ncbi:MAG: integrase arm-type DNA-binding domain-containing protein, partial [Betaproteobacteria bacterium]|nr:integrase arm-type DNA-binding domain-containing protein [Betaproteobacteria bacterium]